MKLGARIIKTGIAVTISLYLAIMFDMEPIVYAAVAAVLSTQPSLYRSWQNVTEQLQANVIGAIMAVTFTYFLGNGPFIVGLVVILVIAINIQLKMEKSISLSIVTVIAIMESTTGNFLLFALDRFLLILLGIGSSFIVNIIFLPPKYEVRLYARINQLHQDVLSYLRATTTNQLDDKEVRQEIKRMNEELTGIEELYLLFKEERSYFRKVKYSKVRKLVVFRQLIKTESKALELLQRIEEQQTELQTLPHKLKEIIQEEIDKLVNFNDKILLKYERKIKPVHLQVPTSYAQGRKDLLAKFMAIFHEEEQKNKTEWQAIFSIISLIIDYSSQLEHLDKLISSYHSYHQQ